MALAVSSLKYRKKKGQVDGMNVIRMGLLKDHRTVFMLKGIGYWICPPYVSLSTNGKSILRLSYQCNDGRKFSWSITTWSRAHFTDALSQCLRLCCDDGFLFSKRVRRTFFTPKKPEPNALFFTINIPKALHSHFHHSHIQLWKQSNETSDQFSQRASKEQSDLVRLFRSKFCTTIEEAMTFHHNNPILYEI